MTDLVTVNAGGRHFMTSATTLRHSGAGYFQALLARWTPPGDADENSGSAGTTTITPRPNKRARVDDRGNRASDEASACLFVDCDPETFEEVLYFMRRGCIKPATAVEPFRLDMLLREAQFFAYDALADECRKKLKEVEERAKESCAPPERKAHSKSIAIDVESSERINLKTNEVLYISSAVLAGDCRVSRYRKNRGSKDTPGCYLRTCEEGDTGDFQLSYSFEDEYYNEGDGPFVISHVGLDQIHCGEIATNIDFRQNIDMCITANGEYNEIVLSVTGSATWYLHCWVGLPEDIPMLHRGGEADEAARKRRRMQSLLTHRVNQGGDSCVIS